MKLKTFVFVIFWLFAVSYSAFASQVAVFPTSLNSTKIASLNFSITNTENVNISRVEIYIPADFTEIGNIGSSVISANTPTSSNPLVWWNDTIGIINTGDTQYFWFQARAPATPTGTNFTFLISLTYLNSTIENIKINVTTNDIDPPEFSDIGFSKQNNTKYSPKANYGFQIRWTDNVNISTVIFSSNLNASANITVPLFYGSNKDGIYVINFTDLGAGIYWFIWYANDTSGNWYNTSNITYVIDKSDNPLIVYLNGILSNYTILENWTRLNITILSVGTICVYRNYSDIPLIKCSDNRWEWNDTLSVGVYEFKANVSSNNVNYTSNSTGATFLVKVIYPRPRFKDLQAPSSVTYSPGATYTFKITFYSPSYPINNITNVSFVFNNQVYYLPINNPQNDTYTFTVKDLAAGSYNWLFCANDTQGESNCTSGTLTISQARPNLDIINVQDYLAPVNKTIIGVGCPPQLVCKLYLNDSELPNKFYELSTDKGGYYIFTFNTSGNANYSAASITKTMTVYPPKQNAKNETVSNTTTTTTPVSQQPSSSQTTNTQDVKANMPTIFKINNQDLFKVTEIEITATENIKNVEVRVDIPLPTEISKNFVEKNKVFLTYIKITTNISSEKIANAKIRFKVEKTWVKVNNIDPSKVFLYKLVDGNWIQLPTQKITEDNNNIYYESTLNSFSIFVIAGEIKAGFPWHLILIPIVIIIVAIIAYIFWPTPIGSEYEKLKQKWSSGGFGK